MPSSFRRALRTVAAVAVAMSIFAQPALAADVVPEPDGPVVAASDDESGERKSRGRGWRNKDKHKDHPGQGQGKRKGWRDGPGRWGDVLGFTANGSGEGYWVLTRGGELFALDGAPQLGPTKLTRNPIALAGHPTEAGYWVLDATGRVSAFGAAGHYGSANFKAVGIAAQRKGKGYWVASRSGKVRAFGSAKDYGDARRDGVEIDGIVTRDDADGYYLRTTNDQWLRFPRQQRPDRDRPSRDGAQRDRTPNP